MSAFLFTAASQAVLPRLLAEHALTVGHVLGIRSQPSLLHDQPQLEASLRARWPYCDPLNHLQVELIKEFRAAAAAQEPTSELTVQAIHLTINGLSAGLRSE